MNEIIEWNEWIWWMNEKSKWDEIWDIWMNDIDERNEWHDWMRWLNVMKEWDKWMRWMNDMN